MHQHQRMGVCFFCPMHVLCRQCRMDRAAALQQLDLLFRQLLLDKGTQIAVRNKEDLVIAQLRNDLDRRRRSHADIANGFQFCGGVDVCHNGIVRILHLYSTDHLFIHLFCHRTACRGVGQVYVFFRRKDLHSFRHEPHAAHEHVLLRCILCLHAQSIGISGKVSNFQNIASLIAVCQNTKVAFFFQPQDLLLNLTYFHNLNSFRDSVLHATISHLQ